MQLQEFVNIRAFKVPGTWRDNPMRLQARSRNLDGGFPRLEPRVEGAL
jgi:hypothetical protein